MDDADIEPPHKVFGDRVSHIMRQQGVTVADLARKTGLTYVSCAKWKQGLSYPRPQAMKKLATALGLSVDELTNVRSVLPSGTIPVGDTNTTENKFARLKQLEGMIEQYQAEVRSLKAELIKDLSAD